MTEPSAVLQILTALLRHFDWAPTGGTNGVYEIWTLGDNGRDREVVVPLDPARGDFALLLDRARQVIVDQYGRSARDVSALLELRESAQLHTTRWQKETPLDAGIIAWKEGESLYLSARTQLAASAKATKESRRYHGNASAYLAKQFLENSFMGQTDVGSFVITAYTPGTQQFFTSEAAERHSTDRPAGLFETDRVSGSEILATFEKALKAVRSALDDYRKRPQIELFLETVSEGVSYEFATALNEMTATGSSTIQIVRHDSGRREARVSTDVTFESVEAPILERVAHAFALDPEPQNVTLTGEVTLLSRSSNAEERLIRLDVAQGADINKARVRLTADQYEIALDAHHREALLRVSGSLEREGRNYWLYRAEDVQLIEAADEEGPPTPRGEGPEDDSDGADHLGLF